MTERMLADLEGLLGEAITAAPEALDAASRDRKTQGDHPAIVVRARSTEDVSKCMAYAMEHRIPVFPRGAGSNSTGACVPVGGGIVIDLTGMNRILKVDTENLLIEAEPGVITADLARAAEAEGLLYGPDPAGWEESTIGGNVATCAGGPSTLKYGVTRDWLLRLEAVLPDGEVITTGARTAKCVAGLDLTRLLCGSGGMLAIVTKVIVRLIPRPPAKRSLLAEFPALAACMAGVRELFASGLLPCALEFLDQRSIALLVKAGDFAFREDTKALLLMSFDGDENAVESQRERAMSLLDTHASLLRKAADQSEEATLWSARSQLSPLLKTIAPRKINEDICVPRTALPTLLSFVDALSDEHGIPAATFGHLGDGNLHVNFMHRPEEQETALAMRDALMGEVLRLEGTITGEHGVGLVKREWLAEELGPVSVALQKRIKAAFDPQNILNPGKVFP